MTDAFGRMVLDYHRGGLGGQPIYERSDGDESPAHCAWYFADATEWSERDREAVAAVRGTVLDAGCGPGRGGRYLRERGHDVIGVDASPRAARVARERGLARAVVGDMARLPLAADAADSALVLGTHVGAPGTVEGVRSLLGEFDRVLRPGGAVVADVYDPTRVEDPDLRSYLEGRWLDDGVATRRFRLVYDGHEGPWRTLVMCSPAALERVVAPTPWTVRRVFEGADTRYFFLLERGSDGA